MKRFRIFEDSAPFLLFIEKSVQEKTQANISLLTGDPISHWVYGPGKDPALRTKKCEDKALEVTSALWKVEQESSCIGTLSETR